ncbi:hypothetical protein TIFTF001_022197 [Ficus carica]|uniref:Uncharacterized protein n=1 Tax=Ficus carica TaxID=3494 RepID=A0AA88AI84_FICCA|nr:hypothetical protein TIFTF001_022197 [Ficus carica]
MYFFKINVVNKARVAVEGFQTVARGDGSLDGAAGPRSPTKRPTTDDDAVSLSWPIVVRSSRRRTTVWERPRCDHHGRLICAKSGSGRRRICATHDRAAREGRTFFSGDEHWRAWWRRSALHRGLLETIIRRRRWINRVCESGSRASQVSPPPTSPAPHRHHVASRRSDQSDLRRELGAPLGTPLPHKPLPGSHQRYPIAEGQFFFFFFFQHDHM